MGMAASQWNFLALTSRKSDISFELQKLSGTKEALARDMQKVTRDYKNALSMKTLKWSGNSGVTYTDLNYSTLMSPGGTPNNSPFLITNESGKVVLGEKYAQYAKMLSDNGGKYDGDTRYNILSGLTGIPVDTLKNYDSTSKDVEDKNAALTEALDNRDNVPSKHFTTDELVSKLLSPSLLNYTKSEKLTPDLAEQLKSSVQNALCGKGYFSADVEDGAKGIKYCLDQTLNAYKNDPESESYKDATAGDFINSLATAIKAAFNNSAEITLRIDYDHDKKGTQADYEAADAVYKSAQEAYQSAVSAKGKVLTAPQMKQIEFYDQLFQGIADMGWEEDNSITDTDYLNQMLQNNSYYITTMTENKSFDASKEIDNRNYKFYYDTEFAENDPNIFKVNDSDAHAEALVKYEADKAQINEKESRIDQRMKNLETEQSAITKMLESIDKVKNDNIDRTFSLWS